MGKGIQDGLCYLATHYGIIDYLSWIDLLNLSHVVYLV